jgi:hypothetical protein
MNVPNHVNTLKYVRGSESLAASSLQSSQPGWPGSIAGFKIESVVTEALTFELPDNCIERCLLSRPFVALDVQHA